MTDHGPTIYRRPGTALVVSGPSGAGKTTVCRALLEAEPNMHFSVSCTTRPPRRGETNGIDYHFLGRDEFERRAAAGEFIEHAQVHGNYYGTLHREVEEHVEAGRDVLLDIDVQGARQVRASVQGASLRHCMRYAFIGPPSRAELERRLRSRGTDADDVIQRRLDNARAELRAWREYDYLIINAEVCTAVAQLQAVIRAAGCETLRMTASPWPDLEDTP